MPGRDDALNATTFCIALQMGDDKLLAESLH